MVATRRAVACILLSISCTGALACDAVKAKLGLAEDAPAATPAPAPAPNDDALALAMAVGELVEEKQAPPPVEKVEAPAAPPPIPVPTYADLEITNAEADWTASSYGYGYGWSPADAPKSLVVTATARLPKAVGSKTTLFAKASCDDGAELVTDTEPLPVYTPLGAGVDIPIRLDLFDLNMIGEAKACRIVFSTIDPDATPTRVGAASFCWKSGSKRLEACAAPPATEMPPVEWSVRDIQMLPTMEFGFSVVAGSAPAPERFAVRTVCHTSTKHFVEFQYVDGVRPEPLEPGDVQRMRRQINASYEFMRFATCDVEVLAVAYDREADKPKGMTRVGSICMRPGGIRGTSCDAGAVEVPAPGPDGAPVIATVTNANFSSYHGWHSAYAATELTFAGPLTKDAKLEFVAECGKKTSRSPLYMITPLDLIQPGHSLRVQAAVNGEGKRNAASCRTKLMLTAKDDVGLEREWTLATQCYGKWGGEVACPAAPVAVAPVAKPGPGVAVLR
jgi:hypothetical protein